MDDLTTTWLEASWEEYINRHDRKQPHNLQSFVKAAKKVADEMWYGLRDLFAQEWWDKQFGKDINYDDCDPQGWPMKVYDRSFYRPILLDAVRRGIFKTLGDAKLSLGLYDRYYKRGELLSGLAVSLYWTQPVFDKSRLELFFKRRCLLPKHYSDDQPQISLF